MTTQSPLLIENIDYGIDGNGDLIFTAHYLLKRGHCCMSGCLNCPYGYTDKIDPNIPAELNDSWNEEPLLDSDDENE